MTVPALKQQAAFNDCAEECARLALRTAKLNAQTRALDLSTRAFSQAEHDVLRESRRQHQLDLNDFRRRCLDSNRAFFLLDAVPPSNLS